jgi:hypothetical protein
MFFFKENYLLLQSTLIATYGVCGLCVANLNLPWQAAVWPGF